MYAELYAIWLIFCLAADINVSPIDNYAKVKLDISFEDGQAFSPSSSGSSVIFLSNMEGGEYVRR